MKVKMAIFIKEIVNDK